MNDSKKYGQILFFSFLGGLGGAIPFLVVSFFLYFRCSPLYLLAGFSAYSLYLYFVDREKKNKLYMMFVILGILLSVIISQIIYFSFNPNFTKLASGSFIDKGVDIITENLTIFGLAIAIYFIISLIGLLITYFIFKKLKFDIPSYKEYRKKNVRKKKI